MRTLFLSASAVLLCLPTIAHAQQGMDAHGLHVAPLRADMRDPLEVRRVGQIDEGTWYAGAVGEYAKAPLMLVTESVGSGEVTEDVALDHVFALNLTAGWAPLDRLRLDVAAPLYLSSRGPDGQAQPASLGDTVVGATFAMLQPSDGSPFGLGVIPRVVLPTGATRYFLGQRTVSGAIDLSAGAQLASLTVTGNVGVQFNPSIDIENLRGAETLRLGLAGGTLLNERSAVQLEATLATPFTKGQLKGKETPAEAMLSYRRLGKSGGHVLVGGSWAMSGGAGAALYRVLFGGGFGSPRRAADPMEPTAAPSGGGTLAVQTLWQGKPVAGAQIAANGNGEQASAISTAGPTTVATAMGRKSHWDVTATLGDCLRGSTSAEVGKGYHQIDVTLAPVRDHSIEVAVVDDATGAPIPQAQVGWTSPNSGCAADNSTTDEAGRTQSAAGPGAHTLAVTAPGYQPHAAQVTVAGADQTVPVALTRSRVQLSDGEIVILDRVNFHTATAAIEPESFGLLDEVAKTMVSHPELGRIEVAGHTDDRGPDAYNLQLSADRATAVRAYLVERGVADARLTARGYGETAPEADNRTLEGRRQNRRVEFTLIDAKEANR